MRWTVHGERAIYSSPWMNLHLIDVELPDGTRFEHHAVRLPSAAGVVLHDPAPDRGILLLYRHRVIGDTWGWEIPAGRVDDGETPAEAARREAREEVGWEPATLEPLITYQHSPGSTDGRFSLFVGRDPRYVGPPTDPSETDRVEWFRPDAVRELIRRGEVTDGLALTALLWAFTFGLFDEA
jgi:8-oxo-dGTP pyrophosphatase MutT (NUDIX family)